MTRLPALLAVTLCAPVCLASPGHAQAYVSGEQLTKACNARAGAGPSSCDGYIAGALDAMRDTADLQGKICPPAGVKLGRLRESLGHYGELHPDAAKGPGVGLVAAFLKANFPCPAK